jgi:hypothetical protein
MAPGPIQPGVTCSGSSKINRNTPNTCNSATYNEHDTTRERLNRTQTNDEKRTGPNGHSNKPYIGAR